MELQSIVKELHATVGRLQNAEREVFKLGNDAAETERIYRQELSKQYLTLKSEGMPATLIGEIARGNIAELKFERDIAANRFRTGFSAMDALKVEINALQSILKNQSDL